MVLKRFVGAAESVHGVWGAHPRFLRPAGVHVLGAREPVIDLVHDGDARAYPLQILVWHEIVDDRIGVWGALIRFRPQIGT